MHVLRLFIVPPHLQSIIVQKDLIIVVVVVRLLKNTMGRYLYYFVHKRNKLAEIKREKLKIDREREREFVYR